MVEAPGASERAGVGRADLVRAFATRGEEGLRGMAALLGYRERRRAPQPSEPLPSPGEPEPVDLQPSPSEQPRMAPVPFWRLERLEPLEVSETQSPDLPPDLPLPSLEPRGEPPTPPSIVPWSRLWPALDRALRSTVPSREIDVTTLVERWSRGDTIEQLPRRPTFAWSTRVTVAVDLSRRLIPFWSDQDDFCRHLRRRLGRPGMRVLRGYEGPSRAWIARRPASRGHTASRGPTSLRRAAAPGETLLVLGDLGFYASPAEQAAWASAGRALRRHGVRTRALVPCPADRWGLRLARLWGAIDWAQPLGAARRAGRRLSDDELAARRERLLTLVSPALRVEPGLLRAVRRLLPARDADVGTEVDVWTHPDVDGTHSAAMSLEAGLDPRREAFSRQLPDLRAAVITELRRWHAAVLLETWLEEAQALAAAGGAGDGALPAADVEDAKSFLRTLGATVARGREPDARRHALESYFARLGSRQTSQVWSDPEVGPLLGRAWGVIRRRRPNLPLPPGVSPAWLDAAPSETPRSWTVWQAGASLVFRPADDGAEMPGSPLATFVAALPELGLTNRHDTWQTSVALGSAARPVPIPRTPSLILTTDRQRVELRRFGRPAWARAVGRDPKGLWAEAEGSALRLRWQPAGPEAKSGFWIAETPPPWATAAGRDRHGLWATIEVDAIALRLRWISPGRFWMGSPESEPGRYEDEGPPHEVTLTRGFWLGETACTQVLWEALMGKNPSRFKSPDRPVENVSWNDCRKFLEVLEERVPGLDPRFPTEAEWEYACRADTETSTYAGELEILGKNNAPLLDMIAWYGGNSGVGFELENGAGSSGWEEKQFPHERAGTHPVAQKEPNPWGLYDMLGNVEEWCSDYWADSYGSADPVQDPPGPSKGSKRVIRGGSWYPTARSVRSAYRAWHEPGIRYDLLGFRLARGQAAQQVGGATSEESRGGVRRGTRRRPSRRGSQR